MRAANIDCKIMIAWSKLVLVGSKLRHRPTTAAADFIEEALSGNRAPL